MATRILAFTLLAIGGFLPAGTAVAQLSKQSADQLYAHGVQAYFNGASGRAEHLLTEALARNPHDPRAYYFRGLALLRSGRQAAAEQDFQVGAAIEAGWTGKPIHMGRALERVQGSKRIRLERIRRAAQNGHHTHQHANLQQRYQRQTNRSQQVVRTEFRLPLSALADTQSPNDLAKLVTAQANSAGDPFADDPIQRTPTPIDIPDAARGAVSAKDLGGVLGRMLDRVLPSPPALPGVGPGLGPEQAPGGEVDPFGAPLPDAKPDAAQPAGDDPAGGEDPFGEDPFGSADEDPFGGSDPFAQ